MKKQFLFFPFILFFAIFFTGCEKEYSLENGGNAPGGPEPAEYTFNGGTGVCTGAVIEGTFKVGTATTSANRVILAVMVDSVGTYNIITSTVNGVSFSGSGTFTATGAQTITLTASGTPATAGDFNFTAGAGGCSFTITVVPNSGSSGGTAVYTFDGSPASCSGATVNGTYTAGTATGAANTVVLNVTVTTVGTYNISTTADNGITFSGNGTFTTTGAQTVTLTATGTPAAQGDFNFTAGAAGCIFSVTVAPGASSGTDFIRCKIDGVDKTFNDGAIAADLFGIITINGTENAAANNTGNITFVLSNLSTLVVTPGTYPNLPSGPTNLSVTTYIPDASNSSDPGWNSSTTTQSFNVVVTSITANRIEGTFSGTLFDNGGAGSNTKTVTNGQFSVPK